MDLHTFANLIETPTLDQVDLLLLTDYYEYYLEPYLYEFELEDADLITLKFNRDNFCHLLGIHKPAEKAFGKKSPKVKDYKGSAGYKRIKSQTITKKNLKSLNKGAYKDMRDSIVSFHLIHKMLENPNAVYYTKTVNNIASVDLLIYHKESKSFVHLGIIKRPNQNYYAPSTFLIEPITDQSDGTKFITGQTPVNITRVKKTKI